MNSWPLRQMNVNNAFLNGDLGFKELQRQIISASYKEQSMGLNKHHEPYI